MNLSKYNFSTLKNPYFFSQIKEILHTTPPFNKFLDPISLNFQIKSHINSQNTLEITIYSFAIQILSHFLAFFTNHTDNLHNEFIENSVIFLRCEFFYLENIDISLQKHDKILIFQLFFPIFIRFLYFIEFFHAGIVLRNKDLILFESDDKFLLFPLLEITIFINDLSLIFLENFKKLIFFLNDFNEEKAILLRIYCFISFMKTMSFVKNLENSQEKLDNVKLEMKIKDLLNKQAQKLTLDVKIGFEEAETPSFY